MSSIKLESNASGTGIFTIASPNSNTNRTLTLPDATGTVVVTGGAQTIEFAAGSASTPSITTTGDTNTGIFFPAADTIGFAEGGTEVARFDSSGNLGIGVTPSTATIGKVVQLPSNSQIITNGDGYFTSNAVYNSGWKYVGTGEAASVAFNSGAVVFNNASSGTAGNAISFTERARISSGGDLFVGRTSDADTAGTSIFAAGAIRVNKDNGTAGIFNRNTNDGIVVSLRQDGTAEGDISVSGTTVSYNGGHLSRYAQTQTVKDESILKGTVLSNLDEMNVYIAPTTYWTEKDELPEGVNVGDVKVETHTVDNEQLNKVKVSDVEGDVNVAGVFVNWTYDDAHQVDEINMAMTGDMIIRIAQGVVVQKGDLLMSAGDGTAKPQDDDIVRSKTVAKVTSNHVTCTYADGSYCVPCVLMAC